MKDEEDRTAKESFFKDEVFDWQAPLDVEADWDAKGWVYDEERYWGGFPAKGDPEADGVSLPGWAVGPFEKYPANPILGPSPGAWDNGRFGGGVHNGSIIRSAESFWYVYRGERSFPPRGGIDYNCKIGLAKSADGRNFVKVTTEGPLFNGEDHYSYEDVNLVRYEDTYYLFCNRWDWERIKDPTVCGCWLATSKDLVHWEEQGIVFKDARMIHRNGVVLCSPENEPVRVDGRFVMYINNFIVGYSDDLLHWESRQVDARWPGGEGCFALADYSDDSEKFVLFTGGHHSGHFYAIGEVLFSKKDPETPIEWLPRPVLHAETVYPHERGYSASDPSRKISPYRDCIFFNGLTRHAGRWWMYYGGSEYYTCLATASAGKDAGVINR